MVYDWFTRQSAPSPEPGAEKGAEAELMAAEAPEAAALEATTTPEPQEATPPALEPTAAGGVDEEALAWARQAYARLKAQQQAKRELEEEASSAPAEPSRPSPAFELESQPESEPEADQVTPGSVLPATPAPPAAAAPSLLEQAAARRAERLQELVVEEVSAAAPAIPPPRKVASPVVSPQPDDEPSLGAFDDTFTWSAEVLAAQGRQLEQVSLEEIDWLARLRSGLEKTRRGFVTQLLERLGDDPLTPEVLDDLETILLRADVGVQATDQVLEALRQRLNQEVVDPAEGLRFLKEQLRELLEVPIRRSGRDLLAPQRDRLNVWLLVGVNGVGKTTTLGKLANLAVRSGYSCLIAAADTFRAAAVQQVQVWGDRSGVPVIANPSENADPAAVVFDAIGAARAKGTELVLVDTAGRLQTKHNLMEELSKVRRIIDRLAPEAAVESLLVLDASQGQNGLRQAMAFAQAAGLTGVVLTKLDGSARGGVALAVASEADLPIRFVGAGEGIRDLRPFNSFEFVEALLAT
ncbi:MAG: signal recognition particle-docking protein FtsY [Synechococcaceae cyanobacterium]|nr:signal recognition particle-docking protein FtsY [Synechococcaceae cyanobacterium]